MVEGAHRPTSRRKSLITSALLWKWYAWLICLVYSVSLFWLDLHNVWEILRSGIDIVCLIGLVCFAYHRAVGTRTFWRMLLLGNIAVELWTMFAKLTPIGWEVWLSFAMIVPLYYALGAYAFGAQGIWQSTSE